MNSFKELQAPCLVCKRMPPGKSFGITPEQAVCEKCYGERPAEVEAVFNQVDQAAQEIELRLAETRLDALKAQEVEIKESLKAANAVVRELKLKLKAETAEN
jgi:hypothetical protein